MRCFLEELDRTVVPEHLRTSSKWKRVQCRDKCGPSGNLVSRTGDLKVDGVALVVFQAVGRESTDYVEESLKKDAHYAKTQTAMVEDAVLLHAWSQLPSLEVAEYHTTFCFSLRSLWSFMVKKSASPLQTFT